MGKFKEGERLSKKEAIAHQSYATAREGKPFSKQVSPEAYDEAQMFVEQLKTREFDWLGINWNKVDLRNIEDIRDVERRLDIAVRTAIEKDGSGLTISSFLRGYKPVLTLAMSAMFLFSSACGNVSSNISKEVQEKGEAEHKEAVQIAKESHVVIHSAEDKKYVGLIRNWMDGHPEIRTVSLSRVWDTGKDNKYRYNVTLALFANDGRIVSRYANSSDSIEKCIEIALEQAGAKLSGTQIHR